ncbi:hypothetical protein LCGC14_1613240 [marine sediment metagenome]|uniref:HNH nuclease domain-containing protein n=1 Tax=marine sediment metagenome TaxID=412755 RepID=A0A0F9IUH5_9ZZZZ
MSQGRYGRVVGAGKNMSAHRYTWIIRNGDIPEEKVICHTCDNGLCININHLFLGTQKDNVHDMIKKGRGRSFFKETNQKGEKNANAKLTKFRVWEIRLFYKRNPMSYQAIANVFKLRSKGHAHAIINKLIWK